MHFVVLLLHYRKNIRVETEEELHPGDIEGIHPGVEQGLREEHLPQPNLEKISPVNAKQKVFLLVEKDQNKPSCSVSNDSNQEHFLSNYSNNLSNENAHIVAESKNNMLQNLAERKLQLVPIYKDLLRLRKLIESYENNGLTESTLKPQHDYTCKTESTSLLPKDYPIFTKNYCNQQYNKNFVNISDNVVSTDTSDNKNRSLDFNNLVYADERDSNGGKTKNSNILEKKLLKCLSLKEVDRIKYNQALKKYLDYLDKNNISSNNHQIPSTLFMPGNLKLSNERPSSYYVSANDFNKFKSIFKNSRDHHKTEYNRMNYYPVMPFLLSDKIIQNLILIEKSSNSQESNYPFQESDAFKTSQCENSSLIAPFNSVFNNFNTQNTNFTVSYINSTLSTETAFRFNIINITDGIRPSSERTFTIINNLTSPVPNNMLPSRSLTKTDVITKDNMQKMLKVFFNLLSSSHNYKIEDAKNESELFGQNKTNEFTMNFIANPDCLNSGVMTERNIYERNENLINDNNAIEEHVNSEKDIPLKLQRSVNKVDAFIDPLDKDERHKQKYVIISDRKTVTIEEMKTGATPKQESSGSSDNNVVKFNLYFTANSKTDKDKIINKIDLSKLRCINKENSNQPNPFINEDNRDEKNKNYSALLKVLLEKLNNRLPVEQHSGNVHPKQSPKYKTRITITKFPLDCVPMIQTSMPELLVDPVHMPPSLTRQTQKMSETTDDYFNPYIYGNKNMMPYLSIVPAIKCLPNIYYNCNPPKDVEDDGKGVISGKVYVTGPEDLTPDKIQIMNPEVLRSIQDSTGPKDVHFILEDYNQQEDDSDKVRLPVNQTMPKSKPNADADSSTSVISKIEQSQYSNEYLLNQLEHMNDRLSKLRDNISKRLQSNYTCDIVTNDNPHTN